MKWFVTTLRHHKNKKESQNRSHILLWVHTETRGFNNTVKSLDPSSTEILTLKSSIRFKIMTEIFGILDTLIKPKKMAFQNALDAGSSWCELHYSGINCIITLIGYHKKTEQTIQHHWQYQGLSYHRPHQIPQKKNIHVLVMC